MCDNREGREKPQFHSFFQQSQKGVVTLFFFFQENAEAAGKGKVWLELSQMYHTIYKAFLPLELPQGTPCNTWVRAQLEAGTALADTNPNILSLLQQRTS